MPARKEMPRTIARSAPRAQRTWTKVHASAVKTCGEGEHAHRTASGTSRMTKKDLARAIGRKQR